LIGKLPHCIDHFLCAVLDLDNHRARFRRQCQALFGLELAIGHQGHGVARHVLVLPHHEDDFVGGLAGPRRPLPDFLPPRR